MAIGDNIKKRLNELGMSQADLVNLSNIAKTTVNGIVNNKTNPTVKNIKKIAIALHTTTDQLIFDENEINSDEDLKRLFIEIKKMGSENQKVAKKMLKALIIENKSQELSKKEPA